MNLFFQQRWGAVFRPGRMLGGVVSLCLTLFGLLFFTFLLTHLAPIDPALPVAGEHASEATYQQIRQQLGLDQSLSAQFWHYLSALLQGDFGVSRTTAQPVLQDLLRTFPATFELANCAIIIGFVGGVTLALISALKPGGLVDHLMRFIALIGYSVPVFWISLLCLWLFYARLHWSAGPGRVDDIYQYSVEWPTGFILLDSWRSGNPALLRNALAHLWLPACVLGLVSMAGIARMLRTAILEECGKEYVMLARALGASPLRILLFHVLPNIHAVMITVLMLSYASLLEGTILVETVFSWPGVGRYLTTALFAADIPAVLGATLLIGVCFIVLNALADALIFLLDPRTR
ncbi:MULTISPECIES: ABC transporter permease [Dickeya]|uniref:Dipeptide transport system permease protein, DppB-like putative hemin permease n=1 Tax=Dickeya aquatica TaxID=1401087 RepID=A0A375ABH7_9GAMM|nr:MULTISPECIES: ABC transporter permease [Dickeya]SLM63464.1 Dipeptide transport system permease protein, DppB-like; putative hemin permease [Dickeya aquatica]